MSAASASTGSTRRRRARSCAQTSHSKLLLCFFTSSIHEDALQSLNFFVRSLNLVQPGCWQSDFFRRGSHEPQWNVGSPCRKRQSSSSISPSRQESTKSENHLSPSLLWLTCRSITVPFCNILRTIAARPQDSRCLHMTTHGSLWFGCMRVPGLLAISGVTFKPCHAPAGVGKSRRPGKH